MASLVIAEHDNASLKGSTLNTITAAAQCGGEVHVLIAGHHAGAAAEAASKIAGVARVLLADAPHFANGLAENIAAQALALAGSYSHILAPATAYGKNILPRVAAKLDVGQVSEITDADAPHETVGAQVMPMRDERSGGVQPALAVQRDRGDHQHQDHQSEGADRGAGQDGVEQDQAHQGLLDRLLNQH